MDDYGHPAEVMVGFRCSAGNPGSLAKTELASDRQRVGGNLALTVGIVVLQRLEMTSGVEGVGTGEELWTWTNFTSENTSIEIEIFQACFLIGEFSKTRKFCSDKRSMQINRNLSE